VLITVEDSTSRDATDGDVEGEEEKRGDREAT